eukprot:229826_1
MNNEKRNRQLKEKRRRQLIKNGHHPKDVLAVSNQQHYDSAAKEVESSFKNENEIIRLSMCEVEILEMSIGKRHKYNDACYYCNYPKNRGYNWFISRTNVKLSCYSCKFRRRSMATESQAKRMFPILLNQDAWFQELVQFKQCAEFKRNYFYPAIDVYFHVDDIKEKVEELEKRERERQSKRKKRMGSLIKSKKARKKK